MLNNNFTVENTVAKYINSVTKANHTPVDDYNAGKIDALELDSRLQSYYDDYNNVVKISAEQQLIAKLYSKHYAGNANPQIMKVMSRYLKNYNETVLTDNELSFLVNHYNESLEYLVRSCNWQHHDAETPHFSNSLVQFMHERLNMPEGSKVYSPIANYGEAFVAFPGCKAMGTIYGNGMASKGTIVGLGMDDDEVEALTKIRLETLNIKPCFENSTKYIIDGFDCPDLSDVDLVVLASYAVSEENTRIIKDVYKHMGAKSKLALVISSYPLAVEKDWNGLDEVIGDHSLVSITQLTKAMSEGADLSTGTLFLIIIEKNNNGSEVSMEVINDDDQKDSAIQKNSVTYDKLDKSILLPKYYMVERSKDSIFLSSLVCLCEERKVTGNLKVISKDMLSSTYKDANIQNRLSMSVEDFLEIKIHGKKDDSRLSGWKSRLFDMVNQPCVLLRFTGNSVFVGYLDRIPSEGIAVGKGVNCLIPKPGIDIRFIAAILLDTRVAVQLESLAVDFAGKLNSDTLNKILIPRQEVEDMSKYLSSVSADAIQTLNNDANAEYERYQKSVRLKKHAISQSLSAFSAMFNSLNNCRIRQKGNLSDEDKLSIVSDKTVKDAFEYLSSRISLLQDSVAHIADTEFDFGKGEWIEPNSFLDKYIASHTNGWLNFSAEKTWKFGDNIAKQKIVDPYDGETILNVGDALTTIYIPPTAFTKILDNIVSNARSHAFTDVTITDYKIRFSWKEEGTNVVLRVENNGTPIKSDADMSSLMEYGYSTSLNKDGHSGIGCAEINSIMKKYGGSARILSNSKSEYPVCYELTFVSNIQTSYSF